LPCEARRSDPPRFRLRFVEFAGEFRALERLALIPKENRFGIDPRFSPTAPRDSRCCGYSRAVSMAGSCFAN
jgi:hypothetical protein